MHQCSYATYTSYTQKILPDQPNVESRPQYIYLSIFIYLSLSIYIYIKSIHMHEYGYPTQMYKYEKGIPDQPHIEPSALLRCPHGGNPRQRVTRVYI